MFNGNKRRKARKQNLDPQSVPHTLPSQYLPLTLAVITVYGAAALVLALVDVFNPLVL